MNNGDALIAVQEYYDRKNPTSDDEFKFTEALGCIGFFLWMSEILYACVCFGYSRAGR